MPASSTPKIKQNFIDRVVSSISPRHGAERMRNRAAMQFFSDQGFTVAGSYKKSMRGWNPTANTADGDTIPKLGPMRASSRDMYMNTPLVRGLLRRVKTNVVGSGLQLQSRIHRKFLNMNDDEATAWEENTEREFDLWASSVDCDASRHQTFYDMGNLTILSMLLSGDVFITFPFIPRKGMPYDLRLKIIESDFVSNPNMTMDTKKTAGGVEVDRHGAAIAYWFRRPNNNTLLDFGPSASDKWVRIRAYNKSGRRQVLHIFDKERPGQRRGIPLIAPIIETIKGLSRFSRAEIDAAVINAMMTVFIKHNSPEGALKEGYIPSTANIPLGTPGVKVQPSTDPTASKTYEMGTGNIIDMDIDEEAQMVDPKHPISTYAEFSKAIASEIGAATEIPVEIIMLHFESSYSAARAAMNEAWKFFLERRVFLSRYLCKPTYEWWMTEAILNGRIAAPGFFEDAAIRAAWLGSEWDGPGRGMIDPIKEIKAAKEAIQGRLSTYESEHVKINGTNWSKAMDRLGREETLLKEKGLFIPSKEETAAKAAESTETNTDDTNEDDTNAGDK